MGKNFTERNAGRIENAAEKTQPLMKRRGQNTVSTLTSLRVMGEAKEHMGNEGCQKTKEIRGVFESGAAKGSKESRGFTQKNTISRGDDAGPPKERPTEKLQTDRMKRIVVKTRVTVDKKKVSGVGDREGKRKTRGLT